MVTTLFPEGFQTVPAVIQSPILTITDAAKLQNSLFRTGIATSLNPPVGLFVHRVVESIYPKGFIASMFGITWALGEDLGATDAGTELTDPRTLMVGGRHYYENFTTSGSAAWVEPIIRYYDLPVPFITIAQQLNLLGVMTEDEAGANPDVDVFLRLHYTVRPISTALMNRLLQRLNLSAQP